MRFVRLREGTRVAAWCAMHSPRAEASYGRRLAYRWFVEFNPLYLLSAALVLGGVTMITHGIVLEASAFELAGIGAIPEVYAFSLIGGAALLMRVGLRRPAVLLTLIAVLYQCDLTMHTETCAYLGVVGVAGSAAWAALFGAKLFALAKAMKLRLSRSAAGLAGFGAAGVAILPYALRHAAPRAGTTLAALWAFSLLAGGLWSARRVDSTVVLGAWARTVKRRALLATWSLWASLAIFHGVFWCSEHALGILWLAPMMILLATRWMRRETNVWVTVASTLFTVALTAPALFSLSALMAAVLLALRALRQPWAIRRDAATPTPAPYRTLADNEACTRVIATRFGRADHGAMLRLLSGAVLSTYLAAWTRSWTGGPWPAHAAGLDLLLTAILLSGAWRARAVGALLPAIAVWVDCVLRSGLVPWPQSILGWGLSSVTLGFALLFVAVAISYWLRPRAEPSSEAPP
jgi:hypothetical protein